MPKTFFRLLAVLLLSLAVTGQGLAAVVAGQCMAFGHHQDAGHDGHGHDAHDGADDHDHTATHDDDGTGNAHCGPCTACCASASIAGPGALLLPSEPSPAPYLFSQLPPPGIQPHGLDRPPLSI